MENRQGGTTVAIVTAITFLVMVAVNALANALPINGVNTGQVSDSYPNLFAPAGLTFAIWGVIYLLLAGYTLYQLGLFQGDRETVKRGLLRRVSTIFSISSLANAAWIFSWHYRLIPLSMLLMVVILVCLILINQSLRNEQLSTREKAFVRLPFSVYFGWITVATIANATTLLVSLGWNGFGISEVAWTVVIIVVGMLIGTATLIRNRDIAYGLVLVWAYAGILIKHTSVNGFSGRYSEVIPTVVVCLLLFLAAATYVLFVGRRRRDYGVV
ncbi:MAG: tryptophan-rich sensory protein [Chloroflexota bacterium]